MIRTRATRNILQAKVNIFGCFCFFSLWENCNNTFIDFRNRTHNLNVCINMLSFDCVFPLFVTCTSSCRAYSTQSKLPTQLNRFACVCDRVLKQIINSNRPEKIRLWKEWNGQKGCEMLFVKRQWKPFKKRLIMLSHVDFYEYNTYILILILILIWKRIHVFSFFIFLFRYSFSALSLSIFSLSVAISFNLSNISSPHYFLMTW